MTEQAFISTEQHRALMAALGKAKVADWLRHRLVFGLTQGRTASSRELTEKEWRDLMWKFANDPIARNNPRALAEALLREALRQKRATVLAIAGRVGFFPENSSNFDYFNAWMLKNSVLKKELWNYRVDELDDLMRQFRGIEANFEKSAKEPGTKAWHIKNKIPFNSAN